MRNGIVAVVVALMAPALAESQSQTPGPITRGSKLVAGSAQLSRAKTDDSPYATFASIAPNLLFFVVDNLAIGGTVALTHTRSDDFKSTSWLIGPAMRYFFAAPGARTLPFIGGSIAAGASKGTSGSSDFKGRTTSSEGVAGVTRLLSRQVGVTAEAFWESRRIEFTPPAPFPTSAIKTTALGVRLGVSAFLF